MDLGQQTGGPDLKTGNLEAFLGSRGSLVGLAERGGGWILLDSTETRRLQETFLFGFLCSLRIILKPNKTT